MLQRPSFLMISVSAHVVAWPCGERATITHNVELLTVVSLNLWLAAESAETDGRTITPSASNLLAKLDGIELSITVTTSHLLPSVTFRSSTPNACAGEIYIPACGAEPTRPTVGKVLLTGLS